MSRCVLCPSSVERSELTLMYDQTTETIQKYFNLKGEFGSYVADPHTAVGLNVANRVAKTK